MKRILFSLLLLASTFVTFTAYGVGAIQFRNDETTRMELLDPGAGTTTPVPTTLRLNYGIFLNGSATPVLSLGTSSTNNPGIIDTDIVYALEDATAGQAIMMQVRAWSASFGVDWQAAKAAGAYFGETDVREVIPAAITTLGTVIWQPKSGTDPRRFYPIVVHPAVDELTINDITVAEGSNGVFHAAFTVRLSSPPMSTVQVDFATQDGTALAGQDYIATNGTVQFPPGVTERSITVAVTADEAAESDETFSVILSNALNGRIGKSTGTCVITESRIVALRIDAAIIFHTLAGQRYSVEKSVDLVTWTVLPNATNVLGVGGLMTVDDEGAGCTGPHFYRTKLLSP